MRTESESKAKTVSFRHDANDIKTKLFMRIEPKENRGPIGKGNKGLEGPSSHVQTISTKQTGVG